MKKGRILIIALIVVALLSGAAMAACNKCDCKMEKGTKCKCAVWGKSTIMVTLKDGQLAAKGCKGTWKNAEVVIDNGVTKFWIAPTGIGPLVVYQQGNLLYMAYLKMDIAGIRYKDKFYKDAFLKVSLNGTANGATVSVTKPNKDILIVWADYKGYKNHKLIKYKK